MSQIAEKNILGYYPVGKLMRMFALPAVVSMLVNSLYNIVDQIFIGWGVGYLGNAATTVAYPVATIVLSVGTLLGAGGSAYAAIKLGEKHLKEAENTTTTVFVLLVVVGILMAIVGLIFLDPILKLFGATANVMEYARVYTAVMLVGVPFNMIGIGMSNMARTDGSPKLAMYSVLVGCVLNTILDPIYIFVFKWGVFGAAIATITSQIISAIILTHYFFRKSNMRMHIKKLKVDFGVAGKVVALGVSSCITQLAATLLQIVMNNSLVHYGNLTSVGGDVALSAMGIVMKVSMILTSIDIGIGIGSQPILGFNRGANNPHRIKETYIKAVTIATVVSTIGWLLCMLIPNVLLSIFGTADPNFFDFAQKCMRLFMMGVFCAGFQIVSTSYFQATGQPMKASILSMMRQLILLIPLILFMPTQFGLDGVLYAGPIADITSGLIVLAFVIHEMKRLNAWIKKNDEEEKVEKAVELKLA